MENEDMVPNTYSYSWSSLNGPKVIPVQLDLKGQSRKIFCTRFFINQFILVPLEMSMGRFIFFIFYRVIALLKWLPGTLETGESQLLGTLDTQESQLPSIQRAMERLFFYLDLEIGLPWVNFKAINLKFSKIVGHIVFYNLRKFQIDS